MKMTEQEARRILRDVAMRRALYEMMWAKANPDSILLCPDLSDERLRAELRRLLK